MQAWGDLGKEQDPGVRSWPGPEVKNRKLVPVGLCDRGPRQVSARISKGSGTRSGRFWSVCGLQTRGQVLVGVSS